MAWAPLIGQDSGSLDQSEAGICGLHIAEVSPAHRGHWSSTLIGKVRQNLDLNQRIKILTTQDNSMVGTCNISLEVATPGTVMLGSLPAQLEVDKVIQVCSILCL